MARFSFSLLLFLSMSIMINAQRNRTGWIDPTDQDFTLRALTTKQNQYNNNKRAFQVMMDGVNKRLDYVIDNDIQFPEKYNEYIRKQLRDIETSSARTDFSSTEATRGWVNYLRGFTDYLDKLIATYGN
ncbi:hypothetical protein OZ668_10945 [Elizabethkingia sp. HX XZB]|uniref:hypothetical protein n=1 Tax=Elizabethkingia TaxID=308865 RepID=UPI00241FFBC6|nr:MULTISPECIES: hypothetical protein [Elizabethkingia]MDX8568508.1 hypothetical protein [Elizabethkingia sp. HX XZB]